MRKFISTIILFISSSVCFAQSTYYVSTTGNDTATGLTTSSAWQTLQYAVDQLSAGDILYMRGGSYYESSVDITVSGTATDPILIKAYPGEFPILDNRIAGFLNSDNSEWEVYDSTLNVYESTQVFPDGWNAYGFLEELGEYYHLVTYGSYAALSSTTENWTASGETYVGPGVYFDDSTGRIYIKLERPSADAVFQTFTTPISNDPRQNIIHLGLQERWLIFSDNAKHIEVDGLTVHSFKNCLRVFSGSDLTFKNMSIWAGEYGLILSDTTGENYLIDSVDLHLHLPDWVSWTDMKTPPSPASNNKLTAMTVRGGNIEVRNCNFYGTHDAMVAVNAHDLSIHHNYMETQDDAVQTGTDVYNIEFSYNRITGPGPSHYGQSRVNPSSMQADYYHHNIINASAPVFYARNDPDELLPRQKFRDYPIKGPSIIGGHGRLNAANPDPWKIYNNTLIGASQNTASDHKFDNWIEGNGDALHEFYNNIVIMVEDWMFYRESHIDEGEEIHDHNIFHRPSGSLRDFHWRLDNNSTLTSYATLDSFLISADFSVSQSYYPPGWEANSRTGDPLLDSNYYPDPNGMAATGALDLSGRGWPGADGASYIGALPPPIADPVIMGCPGTLNIMADNAGCTGIATWTEPTLFGNSFGITMIASHSSGDTFSIGTTTVTYIADNGIITDSCSFDIIVTSDLEMTIDSISNVTCNGAENGAAYITVIGGTTGYGYDWSIDGVGDHDDDQDVDNLGGGTYVINVKDMNECIVTDSVTIIEPTAITGIITATICEGDNLIVNGTTYNTSVIGATEIFTDIGPNNCDSTVTINLTVENAIDTTVAVIGNVITSGQNGALYQWIDCSDGNYMIGETGPSYSVTENGTYAVMITVGNCSTTSVCTNVASVAIPDDPSNKVFTVYPNPTEGKVNIEWQGNESVQGSVTNVMGAEIQAFTCTAKNSIEISLADHVSGLYFVKLKSNDIQKVIKLIKQ